MDYTYAQKEFLYLDYVNNFLTLKNFAEWYQMEESEASSIIEEVRSNRSRQEILT